MKDEIKEILDNIKKCCDITKDQSFTVYQRQDILKLLDCITNLQEENEYLKKHIDGMTKIGTADHKYASKKEDEVIVLQERIDKAIEYLPEVRKTSSYELDEKIDNLESILNGGDDNE